MATLITKKFTLIEVLGATDISLAGVGILAGNAAKIYGPSVTTGASRQSFTPGVGGTLQVLKPGFGYEVVSTSTNPTWDFPGVRVLYGGTAPAPANTLPVANAGSDTTLTLPSSSVVLQGSGSDAEGPVTYAWTQLVGPNLAAGLPSSAAMPVVSGLAAGTYQFRLTVTDNAGAARTDDVVVTVNAAAPVDPSGYILSTNHGVLADGVTDDTDALIAVGNLAVSQNKILTHPASAVIRIRTSKLASDTAKAIGWRLPTGLQMETPATTTFKSLPIAAGVNYAPATTSGGAPTTNGEFMPVLWSDGASNIRLTGGKIDGNLSQQMGLSVNPYVSPFGSNANGNRLEIAGLQFSGGTNNWATNMEAQYCNGFGFRWESSTNGKSSGCTAHNCVNGGFGFTLFGAPATGCVGTILETYNADNNYSDGIRLHANEVTIRNGQANATKINPATPGLPNNNFAGLYLEGAYNNTIHGNTFSNNKSFGIDEWKGVGGYFYNNNPYPNRDTTGNYLYGNTVRHNGNGGVRAVQGYSTYEANIIGENGRTLEGFTDSAAIVSHYNIGIDADATNLAITGNTFTDATNTTPGGHIFGITAIRNTVITGNSASTPGGLMGSIGTGNTVNNNTPPANWPQAAAPNPTPFTVRVEDGDPSIVLIGGGFVTGSNAVFSGGTRINSGNIGAAVACERVLDPVLRVSYPYLTDPNGCTVTLFVNGANAGTANTKTNTAAGETDYQSKVLTYVLPTPGTVTRVEVRKADAGAELLNFDCFIFDMQQA